MSRKGVNRIYKETFKNGEQKIPFKEFLHLYDQKKYLNAGGRNAQQVQCDTAPCIEDEKQDKKPLTSKPLIKYVSIVIVSSLLIYAGYKILNK